MQFAHYFYQLRNLLHMYGYSTILADLRVAFLFQHGYEHQERLFWNDIFRQSKYDRIVERAELIEANRCYVSIRLQNGKKTTVSLQDLAPAGLVQNYCIWNTRLWLTHLKL